MNKITPDWASIIQARRNELDLTQEALAIEAEISPSTIVKLERGAQNVLTMKVENFYSLLRALKWSVKDLEQVAGVNIEEQGDEISINQGPTYTLLPIRALASAGKPINPEQDVLDYHPILTSEYRRGYEMYTASGDSMTTSSPDSIQSGDILCVDSHDLALRDDKIYVIRVAGDGITVKRARKHNGKYWLFSDNPAHPPFQPSEATVLGRVLRWYHRVDSN